MVNNITCFQKRDGSVCIGLSVAEGLLYLFHNGINGYVNLSDDPDPLLYPEGNIQGNGLVLVEATFPLIILANNAIQINNRGRYCFKNLYPGKYTLEVISNNLCTVVQEFEVTQPTPINLKYEVKQTGCGQRSEGAVTLFATGGNPGYVYTLTVDDGPAGDPMITYYSTDGYFEITETFLGPGYEVIGYVTDNDGSGCTKQITIDTAVPDNYLLNVSVNNLSCFNSNDGKICALIQGGKAPYIATLFGVYNTNSRNVITTINCPLDKTNMCPTKFCIDDLGAGDYNLEVLDSNGCVVDIDVIITSPPRIRYRDVLSISSSCNGSCDGGILIRDIRGATRDNQGLNRWLWAEIVEYPEGQTWKSSIKIVSTDMGNIDDYTPALIGGVANNCTLIGTLQATVTQLQVDFADEYGVISPLPYTNTCPDINGRFVPLLPDENIHQSKVATRLGIYENGEIYPQSINFSPPNTPYILKRNDVEFTGLCSGNYLVRIHDEFGCHVDIKVGLQSIGEAKITI